MLHIFDFAREMNTLAVAFRLVLAVLCGGLIGIEREYKRRPAGFRTHILICLGAAMTTLTSQYMFLTMHLYTDVARLGAPVIAGIGFIGAGTIIVTKRQGSDDCRRALDGRDNRPCLRRGLRRVRDIRDGDGAGGGAAADKDRVPLRREDK